MAWTDERLDSLEGRVDAGFTQVDVVIRELRTEVKGDIDKLDARFARLDAKLDARFDCLDAKLDAKVEGLDAKLEGLHRMMIQRGRRGARGPVVPESCVRGCEPLHNQAYMLL